MHKKRKLYKAKFNCKWQESFSWIRSNNGVAHCKICKRNISGGIVHLKRHEKTKRHLSKVKIAQSTPQLMNFLSSESKPTISVDTKRAELKMIMFLAEHNLPFLIMDHLPKCMASAGHDSNILKNVKCGRTKATMYLQSFKDEFSKTICELIKGQKFSIMIDETTDISTKKCLALVIRFADKKANCVKDHFLDLIEIEQCTAEAITNEIFNTLKKYHLNAADLIGFAADNAAVMSGNISGVQARLRQQINPNLFVIGCVCHSMALCSSAAASKLPKQIEDFTRDLYSYFCHSSKRMSELQNFQEFIQLKPKKLLRPSQTRWLSLEQVVNRVLVLWPTLIPFFTLAAVEDNLQAAATLLNSLLNPIYKLYFLFLSYVLSLVNKINLEFQSESPQLFALNYKINSLFKTITKNFMKKSYVDEFNTLRAIDPSNQAEYLPLNSIYVGAKSQLHIDENTQIIDENYLNDFRKKCLDYYVELSHQIKNRFTNLTESYKNFEVLNPVLVLSGTQSIIPLINQFQFITDSEKFEDISNEFRSISDLPTEISEKLQLLGFEKFWFQIINLKNEINEIMYPHLSQFISDILCFPHSSATVERIFSQLNLIKTKTRNTLGIENCSYLLHCKALLQEENCITWCPSQSMLKTCINYSSTSKNV